MKILSPSAHGYLDYLLVALLIAAPALFGFVGLPETLAYTIAGLHLFTSLCTAYPLGAVKSIPFRAHGTIELGLGLLLLASPWLFGFSQASGARSFYLFAGVAVLTIRAATHYAHAPPPALPPTDEQSA